MASYDRKSRSQHAPTLETSTSEDEAALDAGYGNAAVAAGLEPVEDESVLLAEGEDTGVEVAFVDISLAPEWASDLEDGAQDMLADYLGADSMIVTHCYVRTDDGFSAGFTAGDGGTAIGVYIPEPRAAEAPKMTVGTTRQTDEESQAMSSDELKDAVKASAAAASPGNYDALGNNCGDFVRGVLEESHLMSVMPHLSGKVGDLTANEHPGVDAVLQFVTDNVTDLTTEDVDTLLDGSGTASDMFAEALA